MTDFNTLHAWMEEVKQETGNAEAFLQEVIESGRQLLKPERETIGNEIMAWAETVKDSSPHEYCFALHVRGLMYFHNEEYGQAMQYALRARELFSQYGEEDFVANTSVTIGASYRTLGDIEQAIKYLLEAVNYFESKGKTEFIYIAGAFNLAEIYAEGGRTGEALALYRKVLARENDTHAKVLVALSYMGIANICLKLNEYPEAYDNLMRSLELNKQLNNQPNIARDLTVLGNYYAETGDTEQAVQSHTEALQIREKLNMHGGSITSLADLASIRSKAGKTEEAIAMLQKALVIAETNQLKAKMYQVHEQLALLYDRVGKPEQALAHYKAYHRLREEVNKDDFEKKLKNQQVIFEAEQTRKENVIIKAQKEEIERKNAELKETIDELTITRISRRAKAITLFIALVLIVIEESIMHFVVNPYAHENFFIILAANGLVVLLLKPIENGVEHYLLQQLVIKKRKAVAAVHSAVSLENH